MYKGILNVKLADGPIIMKINGNNKSDCSMSDNGTERIIVVDTFLLVKTINHKMSFEPLYGTIRMPLNLIHPFIRQDVHR